MSSSFDPVYAVLVTYGRYEEPLYVPRTRARLTARVPRLWSAKHRAEEVAAGQRLKGHKGARVVKLLLADHSEEKP